MKIVHINTVPNGSTGSIMMNIHKELLNLGHESYVVWGRGRKSDNKNEIYMNDKKGVYLHVLYSRLTGKTGFGSKKSTKELLKKLDQINPDIIHLHNIHGYYINIQLLFDYIKEKDIKVIWTLHDCWPFTGHCTHFINYNCNKWENKCFNCPQKLEYPKSFFDNSKFCFEKKKEIFLNVKNMTIVTPSIWLATMVRKSFLHNYNIKVIKNGVDISNFNTKMNYSATKKYNIGNKKVILGVAAPFTNKKGFLDFLRLSEMLDEKYQIVLVGLNKNQIKKLPHNIVGIERTSNVLELVELYKLAYVFVNPTYEDNYPTTNLESIACGTPIITYDTGGSAEILNKNSLFGNVVLKYKNSFCEENVKKLFSEIVNKEYKKINLKKEDLNYLNRNIMIDKYINLYLEKE